MYNTNPHVVNFGISMIGMADNYIDVFENSTEMAEQLEGDLYFGGINAEIRTQVIEEIIEQLNSLIPNIIIATHE